MSDDDARSLVDPADPEELLTTEPGGRGVEFDRHLQFASLRTAGEWFRYESPLVEHVARLRGE